MAASTAAPSAVTRPYSASSRPSADPPPNGPRPATASSALPRLPSSLVYFQRATSASTGAAKPDPPRSAPIAAARSPPLPDGYPPSRRIPLTGVPLALTRPGATWVEGIHTNTASTSRNSRSASRSFSTPFCAHTSGSRSAAVPPPVTGRGAHSASTAAVSCDFTASTSTSSGRSASSMRPADRRDPQRPGALRRPEPQSVRAQRPQVRAARHQDHLVSTLVQPGTDRAAHRTRPDDDVPHGRSIPRPHNRPPPRAGQGQAQRRLAVTGVRPALARPSRMPGRASTVQRCPRCRATTEPPRTELSTRRWSSAAVGSA